MAPVVDRGGGTVVAVLSEAGNFAETLERAVEIAERSGARLRIVVVPVAVPLTASWSAWSFSPPYSIDVLRAEAMERGARLAREAASLVPAGLPTEHQFAEESLAGVLVRELANPCVRRLLVDHRLRLRDRFSLRRIADASAVLA